MKNYSLQRMGSVYSTNSMRLMKPPKEDKPITDYVSTFPSSLRSSLHQVSEELSKHGYKIYKFLSRCTNGFVVSTKKGSVRFAIKVRQNKIATDFGEKDLLEKNRELVDNLTFYRHPNIISLIESFETKDYHYVVTEEFLCSLTELVQQVKPTVNSEDGQLCYERYASHLYFAFQCLATGPNHVSSTRFVGQVTPKDVFVSYNSELKLNPDFGFKQFIGIQTFCTSKLTAMGEPGSQRERMSYSYSRLLMYLNGITERNIMISTFKGSTRVNTSNDDVYRCVQRLVDVDSDSKLEDVYDPTKKLEFLSFIRPNFEVLDLAHLTGSQEGDTIFAIGYGKCISLEQYTELYELSIKKATESEREEMKEFIQEEMDRMESKYKKIKFVRKLCSKPYLLKQMQRELNRSCRSIFNDITRYSKLSLKFPNKFKEYMEKKKEEQAKDDSVEDQESEEPEEQVKAIEVKVLSRTLTSEALDEAIPGEYNYKAVVDPNDQREIVDPKFYEDHPNECIKIEVPVAIEEVLKKKI